MSIKTRGLVFATFFVNCIVVGLLLASLTTDHWIEAEARQQRLPNATGTLHFGLFAGRKELNVGIGPRSSKIDIVSTIRSEPDFMSYWLWLGTFVGTGFGLCSSALGGIASVMKSASQKKKSGTMVVLFFSNGASAISQMLAFVCWLAEFYGYLKKNVLPSEDLQQKWHTVELAQLGHSFYFVLAGAFFVIINLVILAVVVGMERKERRPTIRTEQPVDEKMVGAIMLY